MRLHESLSIVKRVTGYDATIKKFIKKVVLTWKGLPFFLKICYNNNIFIRERKTLYISVWQKTDVINLHSHNRKGQHKMKEI